LTDYETPVASLTATQVGIDMNASVGGVSSFVSHAKAHGTSGVSAYITYLKSPVSGSWLADHTVSGVTMEGTSGVSNAAVTAPSSASGVTAPPLAFLTSGQIPVRSAAPLKIIRETQAVSGARTIKWNYPNVPFTISATAGATFPVYSYGFGGSESGVTPTNLQMLVGRPQEIQNVKSLEVPDGTDLSGLTGVKVLLIGY